MTNAFGAISSFSARTKVGADSEPELAILLIKTHFSRRVYIVRTFVASFRGKWRFLASFLSLNRVSLSRRGGKFAWKSFSHLYPSPMCVRKLCVNVFGMERSFKFFSTTEIRLLKSFQFAIL